VPDECDLEYGTSHDFNCNGTPDECECVADCIFPRDGMVNVSDLLGMLSQWGMTCVGCELDGGTVGITDLLFLLASWGPCPD
jgi:hypothetical protein